MLLRTLRGLPVQSLGRGRRGSMERAILEGGWVLVHRKKAPPKPPWSTRTILLVACNPSLHTATKTGDDAQKNNIQSNFRAGIKVRSDINMKAERC